MLKLALVTIWLCLIFILWLEFSLPASSIIKKNRIGKIAIITILVITVTFSTLWSIGLIGLWMNGIGYIADNTKDYTDVNSRVIQGEYTVSIDLSDLESNLGKQLYTDGTHSIYVSHIDNTGDINSGGYRIGFRASGQYSLNGASLISGVHLVRVTNNSFTMLMNARMTAEYNGKIYNSPELGTSGLNYKDGDDFSFYIFPTEAYEKDGITLEEKGTVHLTVTNLYENIWSKI